jgi:hypothetical protein
MFWENLRTREIDYVEGTPENLEDYIPQNAAAQSLYIIYTKTLKMDKLEAAIRILGLSVGIDTKPLLGEIKWPHPE